MQKTTRPCGTGSAALWQRECRRRGHLIATSILGYLQWKVVAHPIVLSWCLYMFLVAAGRFTLACRYWRSARSSLETRRWRAGFAVGAGLAGTGWGAAGILLYPEARPVNQLFLVFMLGGMMLGAASILAARPEAYWRSSSRPDLRLQHVSCFKAMKPTLLWR